MTRVSQLTLHIIQYILLTSYSDQPLVIIVIPGFYYVGQMSAMMEHL